MTAESRQRLRPATWLYWPVAMLSWLVFSVFFGARFRRDPEIRKIKGPLLVIGNHPSYFDPALMAAVLFPRRISFLTSHGFFRRPAIRRLLGQLAAIPKTQFRSDTQALKSMFRVIRAGGVLGIYPEGQRSLDGSRQKVDDAIAKLAKKTGCPVVLVKEQGGYLTWPRWSRSRWRAGRIEVRASLLFTADQLAVMAVSSIQARIEDELAYQDYDWQRRRRHAYYSLAPARGLHFLCHQCPACGRDLAMQSDRLHLTCRYCGNQARINRFGFLAAAEPADSPASGTVPQIWPDPYQWHQWQLADLARRLEQADFHLEFAASALKLDNGGTAQPASRGSIHLTAETLSFVGDKSADGQEILRLSVPIRNRSGLNADYGQQFELVLAEGNYRFVLDDGQAVIIIADALTAKNTLDNNAFMNR